MKQESGGGQRCAASCRVSETRIVKSKLLTSSKRPPVVVPHQLVQPVRFFSSLSSVGLTSAGTVEHVTA